MTRHAIHRDHPHSPRQLAQSEQAEQNRVDVHILLGKNGIAAFLLGTPHKKTSLVVRQSPMVHSQTSPTVSAAWLWFVDFAPDIGRLASIIIIITMIISIIIYYFFHYLYYCYYCSCCIIYDSKGRV